MADNSLKPETLHRVPQPAHRPSPTTAMGGGQRNTLTGLLANNRSQGSTPIPPALQARMAAVSHIHLTLSTHI